MKEIKYIYHYLVWVLNSINLDIIQKIYHKIIVKKYKIVILHQVMTLNSIK